MNDGPGFLERVAEVAKECGYVQKLGRNEFHRYKYAAAAQVLEKINEALHRHGIVSKPVMAIESREDRVTKSGGHETCVTMRCDLTLIDARGSGTLTSRAFGAGQDPGDKGIMKAQTAAIKYAWMLLFNISTGDDPEADEAVDKRMAGKEERAKVKAANAAVKPLGPDGEDTTTGEILDRARDNRDAAYVPKAPAECGHCHSPIGRFISTSKRYEGRAYFQCAAAYDTKLALLAENVPNKRANQQIDAHYREWAEPWPPKKERANAEAAA